MPLSQLDKNPALVVIDMQKGVVGLPTVHPAGEITANNARLARAFRAQGFPVVLVSVAGRAPGRIELSHNPQLPADWAELVSELEEHPDDHKVTKFQWGAFHGTSLDHFLRRRGVTQVVLAGISTSIGVESTARNAHDHGYHVALVVDAMTDMDAAAHQNSVERIFPRLGETTTTAEVLAQLEKGLPR
ncbi:TPA: isochorismatase family protein [Serratia marcescens]|nr:isochorismatase family protein [Serratia marcescens]